MNEFTKKYQVSTEDKVEIQNKEGKIETVSCFFVDNNGYVLVQRRSPSLIRDPGKIDLCSGHIKTKESPMQAAIRETREELGIPYEKLTDLEKIGEVCVTFSKGRKYYTHVYAKSLDRNIELFPNEEVASYDWIAFRDLIYLIKETRETRFPYVAEYEEIFNKIEKKYVLKEEKENTKEKE